MAIDDTAIRVAETPTDPLEVFPVNDPYREWQVHEGVRVIEEFAFGDLNHLELSPWARKGGAGAIINIPYHVLTNDCHIVEVGSGTASEPEHHLYEEQVYVLSGRGSTSIWQGNGEKHSFEWQAGSLFAIPLNATYQHFNASGTEPARYLAVTNAPPMMRLFSDNGVIFGSDLSFTSRFDGSDDYFSGDGTLYQRRIWETNFIPNAPEMALYGWKERGAGGINVMLEMAKGNTKSHISEFPIGTYKKAHRHGPGAHLVILSGQGFSLLWTKDDLSDMRKADWSANGMVIVPSDACFHQHFNTGSTRARYLALRPGSMGLTTPGKRFSEIDVSVKDGGGQIEYEDEARQIHEIFEKQLAESGATCRMKAFVPWCTGEVGPTDARLT